MQSTVSLADGSYTVIAQAVDQSGMAKAKPSFSPPARPGR